MKRGRLIGSGLAMLLFAVPALAASPSPEVEAATRAYLDTLQGAARARSDAYFEGGYWLLLWNALISAGALWLILHFGWSARFRDWAQRVTKRRWLVPALYAVPFTIVPTLITLPWGIYTGYVREKQYGFMNQSFGAWLGEQGIGLIVAIVVTALMLLAIFAVIRRFPRIWWALASGVVILFLVIGFALTPVFISPLFNDYKPMPAGPVREAILQMAHDQGVPAQNVYVFDQSKQHNRISANVSGLGGTMRISLNDNLLSRSTPAEIKAVMGHELGHYVLNHIAIMVVAFGIVFTGAFLLIAWLAPRLLRRHGARWRVESVADPAVMPLFLAILTLYLLLLTPVTNSITRIQESQADAFGLDAAREPDGFAAIAMKLSEYRKLEPGRIEELIFFDHPSGAARVRMAMEWKAAHRGDRPRPR